MRLLLIALLLFSVGSVTAQETAKEKDKEKDDDVPVYTTKDFKKKYGKGQAPKPKQSDEAKPDPLAQLQASQAEAKKQRADRAAAKAAVVTAQKKVERLEKRLAQLRNPLLGKPKLDEETAKAWKGVDQATRIKQTEASLKEAQAELAEAKKAISRIP